MNPLPTHILLLCAFLLAASTAASTAASAASPSDSTTAPTPEPPAADGTSWIALPAVFYTPETKVGGGAAVGLFRKLSPGAQTSTLLVSLIYTQRGQIIAGVNPDLYLDEDRYHVSGSLTYLDYPDLFYGIGRGAPDAAEETFSARTVDVLLKAERAVAPGLRVGPRFFFRHRRFTELAPDGSLATGTVPGSEGGTAAGVGLVASHDTRDNPFFPRRGHYAEAWALVFDGRLGSDYAYAVYTADVRAYRSVGRQVLAVQAFGSVVDGTAPFHLMPALGGQNLLRGYYDGRYRDAALVAVQAEYRLPVWKRLGAAVFAAAGDVAPRLDRLAEGRLQVAGGAGLRFRINDEGVNIRLDYAAGRTGTGMYVTLAEAF